MRYTQIHIDLETKGVKHTSQVLSVGAVCNDQTFYREIDTSLYDSQFTTCESTTKWWDGRGGFTPTMEPESPLKVITALHIWLRECSENQERVEVWANSPSFDCAILRHHFSQFHLRCPWEFWEERDVRTVKNVAKYLRIKLDSVENPHHALHDAQNQKRLVESFYARMAHCVSAVRQAQLSGAAYGEEVCLELHSSDRV